MGSSPRVRGKPSPDPLYAPARRLIPARAGKTLTRRPLSRRPRAHPRACGENSTICSPGCGGRGSSPRVRGKRRRLGFPIRSLRGSSPRVRGKLLPTCLEPTAFGLIPARAGKTNGTSAHYNVDAAHPRACGENCFDLDISQSSFGSSPRVRGKLHGRHPADGLVGLIPARAGKTTGVVGHLSARSAHPRACGENDDVLPRGQWCRGSSPRVRGKRLGQEHVAVGEGLIPARAGKTVSAVTRAGAAAAHPRACGENSRTVDHDGDPDGSSPRVRGKPRPPRERPERPGLIPARAGKT